MIDDVELKTKFLTYLGELFKREGVENHLGTYGNILAVIEGKKPFLNFRKTPHYYPIAGWGYRLLGKHLPNEKVLFGEEGVEFRVNHPRTSALTRKLVHEARERYHVRLSLYDAFSPHAERLPVEKLERGEHVNEVNLFDLGLDDYLHFGNRYAEYFLRVDTENDILDMWVGTHREESLRMFIEDAIDRCFGGPKLVVGPKEIGFPYFEFGRNNRLIRDDELWGGGGIEEMKIRKLKDD